MHHDFVVSGYSTTRAHPAGWAGHSQQPSNSWTSTILRRSLAASRTYVRRNQFSTLTTLFALRRRSQSTNMASSIISEVGDRFDQARTSGDLFFFPSTIHHHQEAGVEVRTSCLSRTVDYQLISVQFDPYGRRLYAI